MKLLNNRDSETIGDMLFQRVDRPLWDRGWDRLVGRARREVNRFIDAVFDRRPDYEVP